MNDRNTLRETILKGKGDRTYRKYGEDTGVSYSNIQRLVHKQYIPTPETIYKLSIGDKGQKDERQRNKLYREMMLAAGYRDPKELEENEETKRRDFFNKLELLVLGGLIRKDIRFRKQTIDRQYRFFAPQLSVALEESSIKEWTFKFIEHGPEPVIRDGSVYIKITPMRYARQCLAEAMLIPLKDNRKVTLVTDSVDYYAEMIKFKNGISFAGDLSVMLVDLKTLTIRREEYITHENRNTNEVFLCKSETYTE